MDGLAGKIAVVVGGHGGIGGEIARRLSREGAEVTATSRRAAGPAEDGIRSVQADATDLEALRGVLAGVRERHGRLDVLVLNAGLSEFAPLGTITQEHIDRTFGLNVRALLLAVQEGVELMQAGGSVVLVGSVAGMIGTKGYGVYGASKAAVRSFARTLANELAGRGIRVNVVSPGPIDTAMFAAATEELRGSVAQLVPLGRMGRAEEVAAAAAFLASPESSYVTGAELCVDGGLAQV